MFKKPISKLISFVLTLAICITTALGCFVTVSAQDTPSYVITGAECINGAANASAMVEFSVPQGFAAGAFTIDNTNNWFSSFAITPVDTDEVSYEISDNNVLFYITDGDGNAKLYTSITFKLDIVFSGNGIQDDIDITISNLDFNGIYSDENYSDDDFTGISGIFTAGCKHEYDATGEAVYESQEIGYTVYNGAVCKKCGEVKNDYQVVPLTDDADGEIVIFSGAASSAAPVELLDSNSPNSENNPYIIELPVQLLALSRGVLTNTDGEVVSGGGYYYKVKDGIKAFVMQSVTETTAQEIMSYSSTDDVRAYFESDVSKTTYWGVVDSSTTFNGHFDGNGVEIYGLYSSNQAIALFSQVGGTSRIKNITIKNSYITANSGAGVALVVGKTLDDDKTDIITIENCSLINNYVAQTGNHQVGASAIAGLIQRDVDNAADRDSVIINNCLVYDNLFDNSVYENANSGSKAKSGLVSDGGHNPNFKITNVISLGITPWTLNAGGWYHKQINDGNFKNIYTDASQADWDAFAATNANNNLTNAQKHNINFAIDTSNFKGDAAATTANVFDWNTESNPNGVWFIGNAGQYPTLLKKNSTPLADATNPDWELLGVNLVYKNDGGFDINFHYKPAYESDVTLYVANAESEYKSHVLTEHTTSSLAGTTLPENARMFTISNLSARDIDILWLPTIVTTSSDGSETVYGETEQISIGEYAEKVVMGEAFYGENATDAEKTADKKVAAALINYGKAADAALNTTTVETSGEVVLYSGSASLAPAVSLLNPDAPNSESNPYIIELPTQIHSLAMGALKNTDGEVLFDKGAYFKVKDGIRAFVMQNTNAEAIMQLSSADEVRAYFTNASSTTKWWTSFTGSNGSFNGHFDGNGVEIYGIYGNTDTPAMFPVVAGESTFKNFSLKNSHFAADSGAGIAAVVGKTPNDTVVDIVAFENVTVANNYIEQTGNRDVGASVMIGVCNNNTNSSSAAQRDGVTINNCLVYGNKLVNDAYTGSALRSGLITECSGNLKINNVISLGVTPWTLNAGGWYLKQIGDGTITNVYTDASEEEWLAFQNKQGNNTVANANKYNIKYAIDINNFKGAKVMTTANVLDWNSIWVCGAEGEYPSILPTTKVITSSTYTGNTDTSLSGSGTVSDPYIITNADELYAVLRGTVSSAGKYFKVADGIKAFYMNGGTTVAGMTNALDVKAYFDSNTSVKTTASAPFQGTFDGNGATVYGASSTGWNAGLFPQTAGAATIKNIAVKNSYFISSGYTGGLVGGTWVSGIPTSSLTLENCVVANCYIDNTHASNSSGALIGQFGSSSGSPVLTVDNCLVYGNLFNNASGAINGAITGVGAGINNNSTYRQIKNSVFLGISPATGEYWSGNCVSNPIYTNCYTDTEFTGANAPAYKTGVLEKINPNDAKGSAAKTAMPALAWDSIWYTDNFGGYPSFKESSNLPSDIQLQYDSVTFDARDTVGDGVEYHTNGSMSFGVYQTALSLKANPYMSFAFAFLGDYRTNRENIKVRFTYKQDGQTVVGEEIAVPAYEEGKDIVNVNGWTNTDKNGRYHTYKATEIPVEALANGIKVEANYKGEGWKDFGTYSVSGLGIQFERANRLNPSEYYETRVEAAKALLFYVQAIESRYGA